MSSSFSVKPVAADRLPELLRQMPKAELHIHIEGSLEPELIFALAQRNGLSLPYASVEALRSAYAFSNLQSFLDIYYAGASVLIKEQDFYDMARAYLHKAAQENVLHTELFFDPQTHTARGVSMATVINGLHRACVDAKAELGVSASLILCFLRHLSEEEAFETLEQALRAQGWPALLPLECIHQQSSQQFARWGQALAQALGEPLALDVLKVERIDHGVQSSKDAALMQRLAESRIPLTVCPLSNLKLRVFPDLASHNLRQLLDAGLVATVNSDDPAYFGGYLNENFTQAFAATGLEASHAYTLARNSFEASFIEDAAKRRYIDRLNETFEAFQ